ncbi:uncharacterized protein LAJ45_10114 [Morchella importuna]|uniref:uncharacterized protein n=1 Tax=Morchella importuna TaxID=1174673 RepID=UPI001E8E6D1C|nr:uncharacterized protein LAJ45_10114 [Morchella importuna]KAH8145791.1 hypothetical protein LAJ45_10114 [Morchella importuna]
MPSSAFPLLVNRRGSARVSFRNARKGMRSGVFLGISWCVCAVLLMFGRCLATGKLQVGISESGKNIGGADTAEKTDTAGNTDTAENTIPDSTPYAEDADTEESAIAETKLRSKTVVQEPTLPPSLTNTPPPSPTALSLLRKGPHTSGRYRVSKRSTRRDDLAEMEKILRSLEAKIDRMMAMLEEVRDNPGVTNVINSYLSIFCVDPPSGGV